MMTSLLLHLIQDQFNLQLVQTRLPLVRPDSHPISPFCRTMMEWGLECVTPNSNERTRCEVIVGQIMTNVAIDAKVSLFLPA
ncbi:hypothetical protein [Leptolyngbya ohadii]|uniref:hypothetical protein n=1 Tax=Leptolyngbya ohadii TaxID=1962290 RepID=UPI000B599423|nr:hypothetical protein [Leptolyngbya ohadii]